MSNIKNLLEKMDQFAGQAVGQKSGDQVRGTERAKAGGKDHPFKGRLVGASESTGSLLRELEQELNKPEAEVKRDLFREFAEFKQEVSSQESNPKDVIQLDVPLMIRLLEYAREDAKTDMDLHNVAEQLIALSSAGSTLSMDHYDDIVAGQVDEEVAPMVAPGAAPAAANPAAVAQMKAQQLKTLADQKKSTQDQIKQTQDQLNALRKQLASLSNPANIAMPAVTGTAE
jgi:uncharacterized protein YukE